MRVAGIGMSMPGLAHGIIKLNTLDLPPLLVDSEGKPIHSLPKWKEQRELIKKRWFDYPGVIDPNPEMPELKVLEEDRSGGLLRQYVEYEGEPGIIR